MSRLLRWAQWTVVAAAVLLLFWVAASVGGWSPDLRRLTTNVHGPLVADYRAESPQMLAPLLPDITNDASRDQASSPRPGASPSPTGSGPSPTPTRSGTPLPTPSMPTSMPTPSLPTLPVPTPSLPLATPTLPIATPTPSLPTLPPLP